MNFPSNLLETLFVDVKVRVGVWMSLFDSRPLLC